jgi:hypothetical protein
VVGETYETGNNTGICLGLVWPVFNVQGGYVNPSVRFDTAALLEVSNKEALANVDLQANVLKPVHTLVSVFALYDDIITIYTNTPRSAPNVPVSGGSTVTI